MDSTSFDKDLNKAKNRLDGLTGSTTISSNYNSTNTIATSVSRVNDDIMDYRDRRSIFNNTSDRLPSITDDNLNAIKSFASDTNQTQTNILDQVGKVREDLDRLTSIIARLKIQLDTGALVGNLVVPLDNALGKQANLNGRR